MIAAEIDRLARTLADADRDAEQRHGATPPNGTRPGRWWWDHDDLRLRVIDQLERCLEVLTR